MKRLKLIVLALIFLSGCSTILTTKSPTNLNPPVTQTHTLVRSTKTKISEMDSFRPTPSSTFPPTIQQSEITSRLIHLYTGNTSCQLPCWWNITPGRTSWEQAKQLLDQIGIFETHNSTSDHTVIYFTARLPQQFDPISGPLPEGYNLGEVQAGFLIINNIVMATSINSRWINEDYSFLLSNLMDSFGEPDEIWLQVLPQSSKLPVRYSLKIIYAQKGMILLRGIGEITGDSISICPQNVIAYDGLPPWLLLWSPDQNVSFKKNAEILKAFDQYYDELYVNLEDATVNLTTEIFFETYRNPNATKCLQLNRALLP